MNIIRQINKFSTKKFYEILKQENLQIIPQVPEDAILSKYLSLKETAQSKKSQIQYNKWEKQKESKLEYSQLLNGSPHGSIKSFSYKHHQLTLIATNYFRIDDKKFHKMLYTAKPDAILIQRRPQYHLHNFNLLPKGPDGVFSDRQYFNQLKLTNEDLRPTPLSPRPLVNALNKTKDDVLQQNPQKQVLQTKGYDLSVKYSSSYATPMYLVEMPMRSYRQWLANCYSLMQLQQTFKVICQKLPRYKSIGFSPYQMATLASPDQFLKINDTYMATIIQMLIATKQYKKIVGVFGIVENQAVKHLLQKNKGLNPIIQYLVPPRPKGTIVRDIENLEIIEKHILLDIMFYGREVVNIKTQYLHTTNAVIEKYGKDIDRKTMMQFRYDKTMEYIKLMDEKYKQGEEQIKKQFVRETLRDKK